MLEGKVIKSFNDKKDNLKKYIVIFIGSEYRITEVK